MIEKGFFDKFDKWISDKSREESWTSVAVQLMGLSVVYFLIYFEPAIILYVDGYITPPQRHKFTMLWVNVFSSIILFFTFLKCIRLIRKEFDR